MDYWGSLLVSILFLMPGSLIVLLIVSSFFIKTIDKAVGRRHKKLSK